MATHAKQVLLWKRQRSITRVNANREMAGLRQLLTSTAGEVPAICVSVNKLKEYRTRLAELDEKLLPLVDDDDMESAAQESDDVDRELIDAILVADQFIAQADREQAAANAAQAQAGAQAQSVPQAVVAVKTAKLPDLKLEKFFGDTLQWQTFWDTFNAVVHSKPMSSVEKFQYLKGCLGGEAARLADGYPPTEASYDAVRAALTERYDNKDLCIFARLDAMISMKPSSGDNADLQRVYDECEAHIRGLVVLGMSEDTFGQVFTPLILSKLPRYIRVELYRSNGTTAWTLDNLRKLLKEEILARQLGAHVLSNSGSDAGARGFGSQNQRKQKALARSGESTTGASLVVSGNTKPKFSGNREPQYPCAFCLKTEHFPSACPRYTTLDSRLAAMGDRCRLCLKKGHELSACRKRFTKCKKCGMSRVHHQSLCPQEYDPALKQGQKESALSVSVQETLPATAILSKSEDGHWRGQAVMPTALTRVKGPKAERTARIILDTASTQSFARADLLRAIGAKQIGTDFLGLAGVESEARKVEPYGCYELALSLEDGTATTITVHALKSISCPIDRPTIDVARYPLLTKLHLADPLPEKGIEVQLDIIVGLDHYYELVGSEQIRLDDSLVLLGTKLGYVVAGCAKVQGSVKPKSADSALIVACQEYDQQLDDDIQRLWRLEDAGCRDDSTSPENEIAKRKFVQSVQYDDEEQRYSVRWPWKIDRPDLPENFGIAYGRLSSLLKRLDETSLRQYNEVMESQLASGVIEFAPETPTGPLVHYIPHHCVIRPDKATTKVRIVYDASCKASKSDLSLNECIYRGPVLLADLCGLLMRFRTHKVALVSDIEKAFLQVGLQPVDRDVTRFLWLKDITKPLTKDNLAVMRFARVLFGIIASPYMLGGTVQVHMKRVDTPVADQIVRDNYVDNVISGEDTTDEALAFYDQAKRAFQSASMNLREWFSNDRCTIEAIPPEDRGAGEVTTVLGLMWNTRTDELTCKTKCGDAPAPATKRIMLKTVASLFDPLGFLAPVTVRAKILLQAVWKLRCKWDEPVTPEAQQEWNKLYPDFPRCMQIAIPRQCVPGREADLQLHCFCDASMDAYGAVLYLRAEVRGQISVQLTFAKARVCPLKEQGLTIPRLELTALSLGCRLLQFVQTELQLGSLRLYAWTDSMCSYHWVMQDSERKVEKRPVYVRNRVKEILAKKPFELRYVPTAQNPADLLTKGIAASDLEADRQWWHGPEFLSHAETKWPPVPVSPEREYDAASENPTAGGQVVVALQATAQQEHQTGYGRLNPERFSSLTRLVRVTAWILRFVNRARNKSGNAATELTAEEFSSATKVWLKSAQREFAGESPNDFAKTKLNLELFADTDGILRCRGRIDKADIPYEERFPVFVPWKGRLAELIIADVHRKVSHAGVTQTLSTVRQQFWIPKGRLAVKQVINNCPGCKRYKGGPYRLPKPPPLPTFRVEDGTSFTCVGLDYFGPLVVREVETRATAKRWVCLFVCASSRAIHLEVVTDMTAEQFLLALRRFTAQYGCPKLIVCDNAKQFKAGERVLARLAKGVIEASAVQAFSAQHGIQWKYIVELASWMGGMYERLVGIVKKALRCALQRQLLSLVELQTVCAEVSAIVNARPLTYVTDEVGDTPLRPCDLMTRNHPGFAPVDTTELDDPDFVPSPNKQSDLIRHWKRLENRVKVFWDTWRRDYLLALRERQLKQNNRGGASAKPNVGAVVLVHKEYMPRSTWLLGRIEDLIYSQDNMVRSARVRLADGTILQRPLKLLYPLEVEKDTQGQQVVSVTAWGLESSDSESEE